jgi:pimeloyl-ACP methyl ester carboxylesterase
VPADIPYIDFGGDGPLFHFAHANGYPPGAYRPLLEELACAYHVLAMRMRPLWPGADARSIQDWEPFTYDLADFLDQQAVGSLIGAGHSMGAIATLRLALRQPKRFSALILIDPVLFPPWMVVFWDLIYRLGLSYRFHPLVRSALRRRERFASIDAMFANYRSKPVFQRMDDRALRAYVNAAALTTDEGEVTLAYPRSWEARAYVTGARRDLDIWRQLPELAPPLLVIRGAETNTFWASTARRLQRRLPTARMITIPDATHLVPLERPQEVSRATKSFMEKIVN